MLLQGLPGFPRIQQQGRRDPAEAHTAVSLWSPEKNPTSTLHKNMLYNKSFQTSVDTWKSSTKPQIMLHNNLFHSDLLIEKCCVERTYTEIGISIMCCLICNPRCYISTEHFLAQLPKQNYPSPAFSLIKNETTFQSINTLPPKLCFIFRILCYSYLWRKVTGERHSILYWNCILNA